jgi:predicted membrane protein
MDEKNYRQTGRRRGHIWTGLFLLTIGAVLLLDQFGFPFPDWLFNWHVLLILFGLFLGFKKGFRGGGWIIMILVGGFFLMQDFFPGIRIQRYMWPAILIGVGLLILVRPHRKIRRSWCMEEEPGKNDYKSVRDQEVHSSEDFLDTTSLFSGVHRKVVSKNFKGGDVTNVMGGTEINLSQADIQGTVVLEITQVMGGTKLIVPPHWEVRSEITAILAGYEDKREHVTAANPDKVLVLHGTSLLGGIELKSY